MKSKLTIKKMQEEIISSENLLKAVFNATTDQVLIIDKNYKVIDVNKRCGKRNRLIGKKCYEVSHKNKKPCWKVEKLLEGSCCICPLKNIIKTKQPCIVEHEHFIKGERTYVKVSAYPIFNNKGELSCIAEFINDITERKQAEKALINSEQKYRNLTENMEELVYIANPKTFVASFVNNAVVDIYGYTKREWLSNPKLWKETIYLKDKKRIFSAMLAAKKQKRDNITLRYRIVTKDKKIKYIEDHLRWIKNKKGKIIFLQGIILDITKRKQVEEILKKSKQELEAKVRKRTKQLEEIHAKLLETERLASLGKMASSVAHELRNPMGVIRLAVYSLKKKIGSKDTNLIKHLKNIDKKITESDQIIHDLLAFSRASDMEFTENHLNESVNNGLEAIEDRVKEYKVEVVKSLSVDMPVIVADFNQLAEVFSNLFLNAIQAMKESPKKELKVSTRCKNKFVEVEISDTGCGISKESFKKLAEPFFSTKTKGIGLGLYIAYEIVRRHKGEVKVKSKLGKGTTFIIKLPIKRT